MTGKNISMADDTLSSLMKPHLSYLGVLTVVSLLLAACSRNEQASSATELEKAFQVKAPAAGDAAPAPASLAAPRDQTAEVQQAVNTALSAMKTNGYADAYVTLRAIQASPNLTADQVIAVQNARQAIEKNVAAKAAAGDPAALRAVEAMKNSARR